MIKIDSETFYRDGFEVGYLSGMTIYAKDGTKLGWYEGDKVYDAEANKLAYLDGGYLWTGDNKTSLDYINENVVGGALPELCKCAIYLLIGV